MRQHGIAITVEHLIVQMQQDVQVVALSDQIVGNPVWLRQRHRWVIPEKRRQDGTADIVVQRIMRHQGFVLGVVKINKKLKSSDPVIAG